MRLTRRQLFLGIWAICVIVSGAFVYRASGSAEYGAATSTSLLAISLGVPLMRALTEFSK